ncbi:hypothetical protein BKA70DRAFT_1447144 [Coprinopsis sp. MPI-PUGE-AT-0042]|nr:hypothetical protein BKA70DRAFT_1447144 [Coprinopsis sp. MPI-PUGE-AT-0042]
MTKSTEFKASLSDKQKDFLKDNYLDQWHQLIDSNPTVDTEQDFKIDAVRESIGKADKTQALNSVFDPLTGPADWTYTRIHKAWAKRIKAWFHSHKFQYRLKNPVPANPLAASQPSPEITSARQKLIKLMGECSAKERWVDDNSELIDAEMKRLRENGETCKGAALQSKAVKLLYSDEVRQEFESRPSDNDKDIAYNQDLLPYMLAELAENVMSTKLLGSAFVKISTTVRSEKGSLVSKLAYVGYDSVTGSKITYNPTADVKASALAAWASESAQSLQAIRPTSRFGILKNDVGMPIFPAVDIKAITSTEMEGLLTEFLSAIWDFSVTAIVPKPALDITTIAERPSEFIDVQRFPLAASLAYTGDHIRTWSLVEYFIRCAITGEHFHFRCGSEIQAAIDRAAAQIKEQVTAGTLVDFVQARSQSPSLTPDLPSTPGTNSPPASPKVLRNACLDQTLPGPLSTTDLTSSKQALVNNPGSQDMNKAVDSPGSDQEGAGSPKDVDPPLKAPEPSTISGKGIDIAPQPKPLGLQVPNQPGTTRLRKRKSAPESILAPGVDENTAPPAKRQRLPRAAATAPSYIAPKAKAPAKKAAASAPKPTASATRARPKRK